MAAIDRNAARTSRLTPKLAACACDRLLNTESQKWKFRSYANRGGKKFIKAGVKRAGSTL
jgi:hypothetical protein